MHILSPETDKIFHDQSPRKNVEPVTSWSPVGRRIQMSHRGRQNIHLYEELEKITLELSLKTKFMSLTTPLNKHHIQPTVFDLITAHTPISAHSQCTFYLTVFMYVILFIYFFYKGICCGFSFELHGLVDAIQMSTHNICLYKENQKKNRIIIIK